MIRDKGKTQSIVVRHASRYMYYSTAPGQCFLSPVTPGTFYDTKLLVYMSIRDYVNKHVKAPIPHMHHYFDSSKVRVEGNSVMFLNREILPGPDNTLICFTSF